MRMNGNRINRHLKKARNAILESDGINVTIIYKKLVSSGFDPSTGTNTDTFEEYELDNVIRSDTALEAQGASTTLSAIGFDSGQKYYFIKIEDMPRDIYSPDVLKDYIVDNEKEYAIKKAVPMQNILVKIKA